MRIHIRNGKDGFWAEVEGVPGCVAQGDTETEVKENINRAIDAVEAYKRCPAVFADQTPVFIYATGVCTDETSCYFIDWPKTWRSNG